MEGRQLAGVALGMRMSKTLFRRLLVSQHGQLHHLLALVKVGIAQTAMGKNGLAGKLPTVFYDHKNK